MTTAFNQESNINSFNQEFNEENNEVNNEENNEVNNEENNEENNENYINIFRFKFTNEFLNILYSFSKIHEYDNRNDFKNAWNSWKEDNSIIIDNEIRRLENLGYSKNIIEKMYKSARYYLRKKSTEKKEPKERKAYVGVQKELLDAMDQHILKNFDNNDFSPALGFLYFCKEYIDLLKTEINILLQYGINNHNDIKEKFKKTYKNRYTLFTKKIFK